MSNGKNNKALLGSGLLLALTSSLCCIAPVLAVVGSAGGAVSAFSWLAPLRPYLLGATLVTLGIAFYFAYQPKRKDECGCEETKNVFQSKAFLWSVAAVSVLISAFPYYEKYFNRKVSQQVIITNYKTQQSVIHIKGMSCEACEQHVNNALLQKKGVQDVKTSYTNSEAIVKFDSTQISLIQLMTIIENETGYKVIR
jgi:mercuric ion transport protein